MSKCNKCGEIMESLKQQLEQAGRQIMNLKRDRDSLVIENSNLKIAVSRLKTDANTDDYGMRLDGN